ncbi:MAG: PTS sugar transporter subunit IIB [Oscillospiraceae bacterium]|nr:PTS sugar transporter subunit IIB [Oscillospiraceae bacterium]
MLVKKMADYAASLGIETDVDATPFGNLGDRINHTDILLIGPQVRHLLKKFTAEYGEKIPVIQVMNMSFYALVKAKEIFDEAYSEYKQKTNS